MTQIIAEKKRYPAQYNYKKVKHCQLRYNVEGDITSKSKTRQEFNEETNINTIIKKYKQNGILRSSDIQSTKKPMYGDYSNIDYVEVHRKMAKVNEGFERLTAKEREEFGNKPELWLEKLENDENTKTKKASDDAEALEKAKKVSEDAKKTEEPEDIKKTTTEEKPKKEETVSQTS